MRQKESARVLFGLFPDNHLAVSSIQFLRAVTFDKYDELGYDVLLQGQYDDLWDAMLEVQVAILVEIDLQMKQPVFPLILELGLFSEATNLLRCAEVEVVFHTERKKKVTISVRLQGGHQLEYPWLWQDV